MMIRLVSANLGLPIEVLRVSLGRATIQRAYHDTLDHE